MAGQAGGRRGQRVLGSAQMSSGPSAERKVLLVRGWLRRCCHCLMGPGRPLRDKCPDSRSECQGVFWKVSLYGIEQSAFYYVKEVLYPSVGEDDSLVVGNVLTSGRCLRCPVPLGWSDQGPAVRRTGWYTASSADSRLLSPLPGVLMGGPAVSWVGKGE